MCVCVCVCVLDIDIYFYSENVWFISFDLSAETNKKYNRAGVTCSHLELSENFKLLTAGKNETHKILWDFEIQTDYLISAGWLDQMTVNKKKYNLLNRRFSRSGRVKLKEAEKEIYI